MSQAKSSSTESTETNTVAIIDETMLRDKIYEIRGQKVMLDFDLAEIYGYTTTAFNQQIKNNANKFEGNDFMFQLSTVEFENLMSKKLTSSWGGRRKLPYAFTEQGTYMLMTVLRGDLATKQSRALIRLFKRMKDYVVENQQLLDERDRLHLTADMTAHTFDILGLKKQIAEVENDVASIVDDMGECVRRSELSEIIESFGESAARHGFLFMNGQPLKADEFYQDVFERAQQSIFIVDNYISAKTLSLLGYASAEVKATVFTSNKGRGIHVAELADFHTQYPNINVEFRDTGNKVHDRYVVIDYGLPSEEVYQCGASLKDAGLRCTSVIRMLDASFLHELFDMLLGTPVLDIT